MFLELPFTFVFPYEMFFFTFLSGIFASVFGSYNAISNFKDKSIGNIVKGIIWILNLILYIRIYLKITLCIILIYIYLVYIKIDQ